MARPALLAVREVGRFYDPVYARPFLPRVAQWALRRGDPAQPILITRGFLYTMYPADPFFLRYDETYYVHHIGRWALAYLLDRPVEETDVIPELDTGDLAPVVERFASSGVILGIDVSTPGFPREPPQPLTLTWVGRRTLRSSDAGTASRVAYETPDEQHHAILVRTDTGWEVEGGIDPGWRLYQRSVAGVSARPLEGLPSGAEAPAVLELITVERVQMAFR
jgi:hypothetical protein